MTEVRRLPTAFHVSVGLIVALLVSAGAHAETSPVVRASSRNDVIALEALTTTAATPDERLLAKGVVLVLRHHDEAAVRVLEALVKSHANAEIRAEAMQALSSAYMLLGRYDDTYRAISGAKALRKDPLPNSLAQTMDLMQSLAGEKPMTIAKRTTGQVPVKRDLAGLMRIPVAVNGTASDAVFDSGAGMSTVSESAALRLGIRGLPRATVVASSSKDALPAKVGIAGRLQIGDAVLYNVVFFVLPDSQLTFANGAYKIDVIIGLPVIDALRRVELAKEDGKETLHYGHKPDAQALGNMILDGAVPIVLAEAAGKAQLRLFLDTGADTTALNSTVESDYPALMVGAVPETSHYAGAGGVITDAAAKTLPKLHLTIAGRGFDLAKVPMHSKPDEEQHGVIGQDILNQGKRWAIDFETMSFTIED